MRKLAFLVILILCSSLIFAMRPCDNIIEPNTDCEIITPVISCSTYDLYNSTHGLRIDNGAMSQIGATGMYNFTFNQPDSGTHKVLLCDNTTGTLEVAVHSNKAIYDDNLANFSTVRNQLVTAQADLDNPTQYKADVSSLATTAQLAQNTSAIISRGDSAWVTAVGFASLTNMTTIVNLINALNNLADSEVWSYATRTLSSFSFSIGLNSSVLADIDSKINASHGIGLYNASIATTTISTADINTIANETFKKLIQNKTETYHNNSLGYPTYEIWSYITDGVTVNKSYSYYSDNTTIRNSTFKRAP